MKKLLTLILSALLLSLPFYLHSSVLKNTDDKENSKDIPLTRETGERQPHSLSLVSFNASYDEQTLIIQGENYTGDVKVNIVGAGEITEVFSMSGFGTELIDISALPAGIYFIKITTASAIYTGVFII